VKTAAQNQDFVLPPRHNRKSTSSSVHTLTGAACFPQSSHRLYVRGSSTDGVGASRASTPPSQLLALSLESSENPVVIFYSLTAAAPLHDRRLSRNSSPLKRAPRRRRSAPGRPGHNRRSRSDPVVTSSPRSNISRRVLVLTISSRRCEEHGARRPTREPSAISARCPSLGGHSDPRHQGGTSSAAHDIVAAATASKSPPTCTFSSLRVFSKCSDRV